MSEHTSRFSYMFLLVGAVALAALARIIPHPPNVTPIMALALLAGVHSHNRWVGIGIALSAMFASDIILGFHSGIPVVYACIAATVLFASTLRKSITLKTLAIASVASSLFFFLITNFAVWFGSGMYPQTLQGLMLCYGAALPFFTKESLTFVSSNQLLFGSFLMNGIIGDLCFSYLLFGAFGYFSQKNFSLGRT